MQIDKKQKHIIATVLLINTLIVIIFLPVGGCPWKEQFNIDCAGCGTTRMFKSIIELEIYQAFRYNPLMFILFSIAALYGIYSLICNLLKRNLLH